MSKEQITDVEVRLIEEDGFYYLSITYILETPDGYTKELYIPRAELPFNTKNVPVITTSSPLQRGPTRAKLDTNSINTLPLHRGKTPYSDTEEVLFSIKVLKEPVKEMTMEEIEEKLGHPVKIVKEKKT